MARGLARGSLKSGAKSPIDIMLFLCLLGRGEPDTESGVICPVRVRWLPTAWSLVHRRQGGDSFGAVLIPVLRQGLRTATRFGMFPSNLSFVCAPL